MESELYIMPNVQNRVKELRIARGWTQQQLAEMNAAVMTEIEAAEKFAEESPEPDPAKVLDNVFFTSAQAGGK